MLKVSEQLLVSETAKIRIKRAEERQKNLQNNGSSQEQTTPQLEENNLEQSFIDESKNNPLYNKERAIIQYILRNGGKMLTVPEDQATGTPSFSESVISYLHFSFQGDGIEFTHLLYKKIFAEAAEHCNDPHFNPEEHFQTHPDAEISTLAAEMCGDRYMLSKMFSENNTELRNESAILFEQTTRLAIAYKQSIVDELLKQTMAQLKDPAIASDSARAMEVMQNFKYLKETQQALNNQLRQYGFSASALNL